MSNPEENPHTAIADAMNFSSRDWSLNHRDAWIYGIAVGWGDSINCVADRHRWSDDTVARLQRLHTDYNKAKENDDGQRLLREKQTHPD